MRDAGSRDSAACREPKDLPAVEREAITMAITVATTMGIRGTTFLKGVLLTFIVLLSPQISFGSSSLSKSAAEFPTNVVPMVGHIDSIHMISFSSDGNRVLTGSFDDGIAKLWD